MERAFHETGRSCLAGTGRLHEQWSLVQEYALTPELPAMSHGWETPELDHRPVACKGAPEAICSLCHLGPDDARALMERATRMAESGLRVLGVARARHHGEDWPEQQHDFEFSLVGLVGLLDPVRPEVAGAVTELKAAGVRAVMITGDYPSTARAVAIEVGIDSARIMTGADLAAMDDTALQRAIAGASVFARVRPEQKLRLVDAFKQAGEIVAMTGDGVNDAPALKAAHIGIAMGTRGAEVAREVASLVLLRDDLTPIVSTLRLGRRIYDNLKLAVAYTIAVHIPMIAAATVPVLAGWPLILAPVHIVFLELIITPVCSIVFENERGSRSLMLEPPRRIGERLMSNRTLALSIALGCAAALIVVGMYALLVGRGLDPIDARTAAFVLLVAGNIGLMFAVRALPQRPARRRHRAANPYGSVVVLVTTLSLGLLMTWPALARLFGMRALLAVWT
jgi:Ca2+-transporting ATPase